MTVEEQRDALRRAKEVLLTQGWTQGRYCASDEDVNAPVCVAGAVKRVLLGDPYAVSAGCNDGSVGATYMLLMDRGWSPAWNDSPERTFTDVIDLLDRALASLEPSKTPELVA